MDAEQTIAEIDRLERLFEVPDTRPLSASDLAAANQQHDERLAHSPWFRLWQRYGGGQTGETRIRPHLCQQTSRTLKAKYRKGKPQEERIGCQEKSFCTVNPADCSAPK